MALRLNVLSFPNINASTFPRWSKPSRVLKASGVHSPSSAEGSKEKNLFPSHRDPAHYREILKSMEKWAEENMLVLLRDVEKSWQPSDFLPDPTLDGFQDEVKDLRERSKGLPDDYLVVLVGDMITEEALPTYQTLLNTAEGIRDETCASPTSWARWIRAWTAEENRHGDLLNKYLYLTGRVDMRQVEKSIQYLLGSGMDSRTDNHPYFGLIYTSFQEKATFVSHSNTARLAKEHGDMKLAQICGIIAADEKRHEIAYTKVIEKLFEIDPDATILSFAELMRRKIVMPAQFIYDGQDEKLYNNFSAVAQRLGVYTARDYVDILEFFVARWKVETLAGLSDEGRRAQEYVCGLTPRFRKLEERVVAHANKPPAVPFSWIFNKEIHL